MNYEMKMPDLATTGGDVTVVRWLVEEGETVKRGQPILEVETDKAVMEVESVTDGILQQIVAQDGDQIGVGELLARLETAGASGMNANGANVMGENASREIATGDAPSSSATSIEAAASPTGETTRAASATPSNAPASTRGASMFARNRQRAQQNENAAPQNDVQQISAAHRTAARRMQQSKQNAPHFYLQTSLDAAPMAARRNDSDETKIAWDAFFVWASARALEKFSRLKMRYENENLVAPESEAVGVAVDLDGDLYVVSIESPAAKTPEQISEELRESVKALRDGDAAARGLKPACMTISNLGAANVESFIAIINPPQSCILAIGKIADVPVVTDGKIEIGQRATLSLSVDHRVVSGRYAADFLGEIVRELEEINRS